jgi:hypothetical protein
VKTRTLAFAFLCCKTRSWTTIYKSLQNICVRLWKHTHTLLTTHTNKYRKSVLASSPNKCNSRIWSVPEFLCFPWMMLQRKNLSLVGSSDLNLWKENKTNWITIQQQHFGLGPSSKGLGTNLKLSTIKIVWILWSLDLGPSSKVAIIIKIWLLGAGGRGKKVLNPSKSGDLLTYLLEPFFNSSSSSSLFQFVCVACGYKIGKSVCGTRE